MKNQESYFFWNRIEGKAIEKAGSNWNKRVTRLANSDYSDLVLVDHLFFRGDGQTTILLFILIDGNFLSSVDNSKPYFFTNLNFCE